MAALWSAVGVAAALAWLGVLFWSDRHPARRLWPPHRGSLVTAAWAWALTIAIYLGVLRAGFAEPSAAELPDWLRWGVGGSLSVVGSVFHSWGTLHLGLKATSGWPAPRTTSGPYAWHPHPQYLGQIAMLIGLALILGTVWAFWPALAGSAALLYAMQVEDRHLDAAAGGAPET